MFRHNARTRTIATQALAVVLVLVGLSASAGTLSFSGTRANENPLTPIGVGRCGPGVRTVSIAPGNTTSTGTSNLGDFASTQSHCISGALSPSTPVLPTTNGEFVYDFGMGDTLRGTYTGTVSLAAGVITGLEDLIVMNGTGRFAGATGFITSRGTLQFLSMGGPPTSARFSGVVDGRIQVSEPATWSMLFAAGLGCIGRLRTRVRHHRGNLSLVPV